MKGTSIIIFCILLLIGCNEGIKKGSEIKENDLNYLQRLGLLTEHEEVIYFSSNMDNESSGNFITNKRVAAYWIYGSERKINSAFFSEIDSVNVIYIPKENELTTRIEVFHGDSSSFMVYIRDSNEQKEKNFAEELKKRIANN